MENGLLTLSLTSLKSALISAVIVGVGALLIYIVGVGDVFKLDWHMIINAPIMAFAGSLIKNFFTTNDGKFLGMTNIG